MASVRRNHSIAWSSRLTVNDRSGARRATRARGEQKRELSERAGEAPDDRSADAPRPPPGPLSEFPHGAAKRGSRSQSAARLRCEPSHDVKPEATTIAEPTRSPRLGTSPQHREAEDRCPDRGQVVKRRKRRVWDGCSLIAGGVMPIDRPEAEPEQGQKFDPRAYTPEAITARSCGARPCAANRAAVPAPERGSPAFG